MKEKVKTTILGTKFILDLFLHTFVNSRMETIYVPAKPVVSFAFTQTTIANLVENAVIL